MIKRFPIVKAFKGQEIKYFDFKFLFESFIQTASSVFIQIFPLGEIQVIRIQILFANINVYIKVLISELLDYLAYHYFVKLLTFTVFND